MDAFACLSGFPSLPTFPTKEEILTKHNKVAAGFQKQTQQTNKQNNLG